MSLCLKHNVISANGSIARLITQLTPVRVWFLSSTTLFILIIAEILTLLIIGYINHSLEINKLEKARRKADLADRCRRCAMLSTGLPSQLTSVDLKQLLTRLELH